MSDSVGPRVHQEVRPDREPSQPASSERGPAAGRRRSPPWSALLDIQRRAGNGAARRVLQRKLVVGASDDRFEREADRVAEHVVAAVARVAPTTHEPASTANPASTRIRAAASAEHIMRNGDELQSLVAKMTEASDLMSLRVQLTEWDGAEVERIARLFGIERFQAVVFALGHDELARSTPGAMGAIDAKNPLAIPVGSVAKRATIAKRWKLPVGEFATHLASVVATETATTGEIMKVAREYGVSFPVRFETVLAHAAFSADSIRPELEVVSQPERDVVWQDKRLMAEAKRRLSKGNYLAMLPVLRVFEKPAAGKIAAAKGAWDQHTSAADVDRYIHQHLKKYVGALPPERKALGEISVVDDPDWEYAFRRQWPTLDPAIVKPNAFVDVDQPKRHIWIHKDRGDSGTAIHEGMHKYASYNIRNIQRVRFPGKLPISQLDEGLTEYFTRLVTGPLGINRTSYPNPFDFATRLIGTTSEAIAAKAYFEGDLDGLVNAYLSASKRSQAQWELFATALEKEQWVLADRVWNTGA